MEGNPVHFTVDYPEKSSRGLLFLRWIAGIYVGIPHGFCLFFYSIAASVVLFIAWWAILFTGKFPKGMYDFILGFYRWQLRVNAYMTLLTDKYPPFSGKE